MSVNVDLLRRTLAHIEQHPEEWNQKSWRCETGMCFAGWAATLAGGQWAAEHGDQYDDTLIARDSEPNSYFPSGLFRTSVALDTPLVGARFRAAGDLGITEAQAFKLFDGDNTLDDLRRIVGELCDGAA